LGFLRAKELSIGFETHYPQLPESKPLPCYQEYQAIPLVASWEWQKESKKNLPKSKGAST
jgi:hypothetical protein